MLVAIAGTRIGTRLLERFSDDRFRQISGQVILAIATVCVVKGVMGLAGW